MGLCLCHSRTALEIVAITVFRIYLDILYYISACYNYENDYDNDNDYNYG